MIRAMRARRMKMMLLYYASMTAFFLGAASLTRLALRHGHRHNGHTMPVPESVAGKGIDEIVDAEEAELTEDTERFAKVVYKEAPEDKDVEI